MAKQDYLPTDGSWVGPPVLIRLSGGEREILDGRKRLLEIERRGFQTVVPELIAKSHLDVVKHLTLAGHQVRAADYARAQAPHLAAATIDGLAKATGVYRMKWVPFVMRARGVGQHVGKKSAKPVVVRARQLVQRMREGHIPDVRDLEYVLGEWLE